MRNNDTTTRPAQEIVDHAGIMFQRKLIFKKILLRKADVVELKSMYISPLYHMYDLIGTSYGP